MVNFLTESFTTSPDGDAGEGEELGEGEPPPSPSAIDLFFAGTFTSGKRKRR